MTIYNRKTDIQLIRNRFIKSISCQFLPFLVIGASIPLLEMLPKPISSTISLFAIIAFLWGYVDCWMLTYRYAEYKGYPQHYGFLGLLNIFGLSILFFLKNKNSDRYYRLDRNPLENFSISAIFISYLASEIVFMPIIILGLIIIGNVEPEFIGDWLENEDFMTIISIPINIFLTWYFFRELKKAKINIAQLVGSLKKIDFKLAIGLAIVNYLFARATSNMILYCLSFIVPKYVESQINKVYATTSWGYACFAILVLIFAPIIEELFFRGVIFQKLAITRNSTQALIISALLFTVIHFRFDIISLFVIGVTLAILYLKTKQMIVPIISHLVYNLIFLVRSINWYFFSNVDHSRATTITEFQQDFIDNLEWKILFIAVSVPYLCYFIYKNFPRNYDLKRLPYFANVSQKG